MSKNEVIFKTIMDVFLSNITDHYIISIDKCENLYTLSPINPSIYRDIAGVSISFIYLDLKDGLIWCNNIEYRKHAHGLLISQIEYLKLRFS